MRTAGLVLALMLSTIAAALAAGKADPVPEFRYSMDNPPRMQTGLCLLFDAKHRLLRAEVGRSSGDPVFDESAAAYTRSLYWPPGEKNEPGWIGITIGMANLPSGPLPNCPPPAPRKKDKPVS